MLGGGIALVRGRQGYRDQEGSGPEFSHSEVDKTNEDHFRVAGNI